MQKTYKAWKVKYENIESKMIRFSYKKREKGDWSRKRWQQEHKLEYGSRGTKRR